MAFNKVTSYGESENILESEVGLVVKTRQGTQAIATTEDGRKVIKAGTLFPDSGDTYAAVTPATGDNPSSKGWYELSGGTYVETGDTTVTSDKTYYAKTTENGLTGVVLADYDVTDCDVYPIAVVVAGRVKADKVSADALAQKSAFAAQGLYLV